MPVRYTHEQFLEKVHAVYSDFDKNYKILNTYKNSYSFIYLQTEFGIVKMLAYKLLIGVLPCNLHAINFSEFWKARAKKFRNNSSEYLEVNNKDKKVTFRCRKCNTIDTADMNNYFFVKHPCKKCRTSHLQKINRKTTEQFIKESEELWGARYDYSLCNYETALDKVTIICKSHATEFHQKPNDHLSGHEGCPNCYSAYKRFFKNKNIKERVSFYVYVLRLYSEDENFYKVGISRNVKNRIQEISKSGYKVEIQELIESDLEHATSFEIRTLKDFKYYKYNPKIKFDGYTECFSVNPYDIWNYQEEYEKQNNYEYEI